MKMSAEHMLRIFIPNDAFPIGKKGDEKYLFRPEKAAKKVDSSQINEKRFHEVESSNPTPPIQKN